MIHQFKITLNDIQPEIWREVHVEGEMALDELHYIIQTAMYWSGEFVFEFAVGSKVYGEPDEDEQETMEEAADYAIEEVFTSKGLKAKYTYDEGWNMTLELLDITEPAEGVTYPFCAGGARNSPVEECGSPEGYEVFLKTINDPKNPDRAALLEDLGGEFDPEGFDVDEVNEEYNNPENWEDLEDDEDEE
jgi:hypothetical protein